MIKNGSYVTRTLKVRLSALFFMPKQSIFSRPLHNFTKSTGRMFFTHLQQYRKTKTKINLCG